MLKAFGISDIGKKRKLNQDYVYVTKEPVGKLPNLFLVADGMGGHNAGDFASKITVETVLKEIAEDGREDKPDQILTKAIEAANEVVVKVASCAADLTGMGTTVVAATCMGKTLYVANVGDSRLYVSSREGLTQITTDHSLVEEMVRMGGIARDDARNHPDKNIITRAVGGKATVEVDCFTVELQDEDTILMCSDGLSNMLEDEEIQSILRGGEELSIKAQTLVDRANANGGKDNISVILVTR